MMKLRIIPLETEDTAMKKTILSLLISFIALNAFSQNANTAVSTNTEAGRYEIVMSNLQAKQTFKVDKYNGDVFQLAERSDGTFVFERLYRDTSSAIDTRYPNQINYQLVMSGILAKCTFLININTGEVWNLVYDSKARENWLIYVQ